MECRDVSTRTVDRLSGELSPNRSAELDHHLASCERCRDEARELEASWERLLDDPDPVPGHAFRSETLALLREETLARRVKPFRPADSFRPHRPGMRPPGGQSWIVSRLPAGLSRIAAVLAAGVCGYSLARGASPTAMSPTAATPVKMATYSVAPQRTIDVSSTLPDLSGKPRLANVAFRPADESGRIGVSFDVTTRYTVVGRPEEKGVADTLAYLVSGMGDSESARGRAIELVSQHFGDEKAAPPSSAIVKVLAQTLTTDKNPGVRKKAAEALAQLPPTPETRDALMLALQADENPAIRILAVEALARTAAVLNDPQSIETLREKASDPSENGYVRGQAAQALARLRM